EALTGVIKKITSAGLVDEKLVKEVVKDIQRALLQADVNVKLVMALSRTIEERALKEKPRAGLSKKEHAATIVYEELVRLLGRKQEFVPKKSKIMLVGLQGSGKTTTAVKLAKFYMKRGLRPFVIIADTFRPAAYEQAVQLAEPLNINVYGEPGNKDSMAIARKGLEGAGKSEVIILDTAGRHKSEAELFEEMKQIFRIYQPEEKLLVIDSSIGQQAGAQARAFHEAIGITGVILTKVDGSAKGGGALSAVAETASPIRFIGTGEKVDNIELFDAERFISRLLGMGDLAALLEKAKETMDEDAAEKLLKGEFTLFDLQEQIAAIRKLGPLSSVLKMIPGLGAAMPKETSEVTETKLKKFLVILDSM
ncbi:MAG: signal recognition particle receptor subunit alpha, partial [Candidatus Hydrothermarchaeota archaeon]|nr:signal recognition particle receptor subunit alpha [Candidatus Hydrothermarchaeota archaeon]